MNKSSARQIGCWNGKQQHHDWSCSVPVRRGHFGFRALLPIFRALETRAPMNRAVWMYWENFGNTPEPAYITLCRWTMLHNWRDENLIFLNPGNVDFYLPGILAKVEGIESSISGRRARLIRKFVKSRKSLAVKADVIRASVLRHYGGLYVDSSAIALGPLTRYFDLLQRDGARFVVSQRSSHGRSDYPVSFYGCTVESRTIQEYVTEMYRLLSQTKEFDYNGLGTILLTPCVRKHLDECVILPESEVMPITYEDADKIYCSTTEDVGAWVNDDHAVFKVFNAPFHGSLKDLSVVELYQSDTFIGRLFRHALPEDVFMDYLRRQGDPA